MRFIIFAPNIHQGGGKSLLLGVLPCLRDSAMLFLDQRLGSLPWRSGKGEVINVLPTVVNRLKAELKLCSISKPGDTLFCFGNLPPLFPNRANVFVYLQNRYLVGGESLFGFPWRARLRINMERLWLRLFLRNGRLLVQTETMAQAVRKHLGKESHVLPFQPPLAPSSSRSGEGNPSIDYLYVASGEPHKNHHRLVDAWIELARRNCYPSLCLTLDPKLDDSLWGWIRHQCDQYGLHISTRPTSNDQMPGLYAQAAALIYPSLFESFGLPLLEARVAGLPIIAAERDYVRDVVVPVESFDPESAMSIARAVLRHQQLACEPSLPSGAEEFLQRLEELN